MNNQHGRRNVIVKPADQHPSRKRNLAASPCIDPIFEVVAQCSDERQQKTVFERLRSEGIPCRLFTL
jgi:hypothetical protein